MKTSNVNAGRLAELRAVLRKAGVDYYMIPTADFHNSEYCADYFKERFYFSGFSGSAGTLVVSQTWAGLWTDGRYWVQAAHEIDGSGVTLYKMGEPGVPTIQEFLLENMLEGQVLGFDGRCVPYSEGKALKDALKVRGISIYAKKDLGNPVFRDRPKLPLNPMFVLPEKYSGESCKDRLGRLRTEMQKQGAAVYVSSKLDDLMWLTNLRGNDIPCNPVALSHALITLNECHLFVQEKEWTKETRRYAMDSGITIHPYGDFADFLGNYEYSGNVMMDPSDVSYTIFTIVKKKLKSTEYSVIKAESPILYMKAVKNETEQQCTREIYLDDSAVVCRFIYWLTNKADIENLTELDAARYLDHLRSEIPDYIELSFDTISAYGANAAMMHYDPAKQTPARLERKGMLLVDSGGTYLRGTTDVTRTTALGPVTDSMKKDYTLTAAGNLALMNAKFIAGCTGINLDILAREPLWREGMDYKCGTGHGIGFVLNVHEGPQGIRWRNAGKKEQAVFKPGMNVSDEPGVYKEGEYGIRIESILLTKTAETTADGTFYDFEPLTYVPLDRALLDPQYLTDRERKWVDDYHAACREKILPLLQTEAEKNWLIEQTEKL